MKLNGGISVYDLMYTFKQKKMDPFKGVSLSQFHILVASILGLGTGVAGLLMARRDSDVGWFSSLPWTLGGRDLPKRLCLVAGLQNLGNNCFLNVILQALASCSCFLPFLENTTEADDLEDGGIIGDLPLSVALVALLKELCILRDVKVVLSPRRVMLAMDLYVTSFNLTRQQDAAEAFLHLMSSLKEELAESYVPFNSSLAEISSFPVGGISSAKRRGGKNEHERWQQHLFGPFDGTLGSILTCKSCSCQLSMDFQFFQCLPLSLLLDSSSSIMDGCTVEDCLQQFTVTERIENYSCNRCWHIAALKYLSLNDEGNRNKIEKLRHCTEDDSCDCKNILLQEGIKWPTVFSSAVKKLSIGRCPKILCIHLQRASMNNNGELVKLQGHISFPLVLDFFPFTAAKGIGLEISERDTDMQVNRQFRPPLVPRNNHFSIQVDMLPQLCGAVGENRLSVASATCLQNSKREEVIGKNNIGCKIEMLDVHHSHSGSEYKHIGSRAGCHDQMSESHPLHSKNYIYRLVSVAEHYGRCGSGHYAVYRRAKADADAEDSGRRIKTTKSRWFYVSDTEVSSISEETVLAAEASLLFYERIDL